MDDSVRVWPAVPEKSRSNFCNGAVGRFSFLGFYSIHPRITSSGRGTWKWTKNKPFHYQKKETSKEFFSESREKK